MHGGSAFDQVTRQPGGTESPEQAGRAGPRRWSAGGQAARPDRRAGQGRRTGARQRCSALATQADPLGLACPVGAHIRRANPHDSLPRTPPARLTFGDHHRLARRSASSCTTGQERASRNRALFPSALAAANLSRAVRSVQHTWLNNTTVQPGLYADTWPAHRHPPAAGGDVYNSAAVRCAVVTVAYPSSDADTRRRPTSSFRTALLGSALPGAARTTTRSLPIRGHVT